MIISKDLFIFGEQIFATIIPEGGSSQQQQQQQFQLTQQGTILNNTTTAGLQKVAQTTTPATTITATTTTAAQQVVIVEPPTSLKKTATVPTLLPPPSTTTATAATTNAIKTKTFNKQETVAIAVVGSGTGIGTGATTAASAANAVDGITTAVTLPSKRKIIKVQKIPKEAETTASVKTTKENKIEQKQQQKFKQRKYSNNEHNLSNNKRGIKILSAKNIINNDKQKQQHKILNEKQNIKEVIQQQQILLRKQQQQQQQNLRTTSAATEEKVINFNNVSVDVAEDDEDQTESAGLTREQTPLLSTERPVYIIQQQTEQQQQKHWQQQHKPEQTDCRLQLEPPTAIKEEADQVVVAVTQAFNQQTRPLPATTTTKNTNHSIADSVKPVAIAATTDSVTANCNDQPAHIINNTGEDLSIDMGKIILDNNYTRPEHAMASYPFITEQQQRTIQLTFQNINVLHNERKILSDVSGIVSPGEVLAVMGPSGSGKTTLLDCISGQRRVDGGSIYFNREPVSKKWRRKICYVLQEEIFFSGLTLRETVMYTAMLRLPEKMPKEEKIKLVDRILETLELNFCQQTKFGDYLNRGLSGGEKKRANIACELLTNPLLMLLDEPTSGLDSHSAISLMKVLKRYAIEEQKTVVITVHQPSSQMFHMFDKLLLLYNGQTAYFGEVNNIYRYFEDIGVAIKPHYNPADFVLEQLKSHPDIREKLFIAARESHGNFINRNCINALNNQHNRQQHQPNNHTEIQNGGLLLTTANGTDNYNSTTDVKDHQQHKLINDIINNYYKDMHNNHKHHINSDSTMIMLGNQHHDGSCEEAAQQLWCGGDSQSNFSSASSDFQHYESAESGDWLDYPTRFHTQFSVLSSRNFKEAKPRMLSKLNWFQTVGLALMAGAIWFQIPRTEEFLHDLQGWMFFSQTYWMLFALFGALNSFPSEREVISKERRSGAYRLSAYYLAKMFGELPLVITLPTVYLIISYPLLGCTSLKLFLLMLVFLLLNTIVAQSVGFFIGACCMDMNVSITLSALYTLATQLFGGYLSSRIPDGLSWIRYVSMIHYAYQNMQILEFREGPAIRCGNPSSYEVCKNNTTEFIPYEEILKAQNSTSPLWLNTLILMMFFLVFRGLGYAVLRYVRCPKV